MEHIRTQLQQIRPELPIHMVQLPEGHSMNDMWVNYGSEAIAELINTYEIQSGETEQLDIINDYKITYNGKGADYTIRGQLPNDMGSMRIALTVTDKTTQRKHRIKVDLFDSVAVHNQCTHLYEKHSFDYNLLEADLINLADLLEAHREQRYEADSNPITEQYSEKELTPKAAEKAIEFLSNPRLFKSIDKLLEQSGIVGEETNRKMIFVIASSYKTQQPLHGMVKAVSGAGKSYLINSITACMPQEDVLDFTRITSKSLYHYKEKELTDKLIVLQDFDGLDEDAEYAFREMQSNKQLSSSTVVKDRFGNTTAKKKVVKGHFASLCATTQTEIYLDNESRSILVGIDESLEQTLRIMDRQNQKRTGAVDAEGEQEAKQLLRNCMRVLKKYEVINPYADKLRLPVDARMLRRLNEQFQDFICQITLLHQYQRRTDTKGRLITTKEDITSAIAIFFDAILLKIDELDSTTRQFFENLKTYVKVQPSGSTYKFTEREIRQHSKLGKSTVNRYISLLRELEYIQCVEGAINKGYKYVITYWDDIEKLKAKIKTELNTQVEML